MSVTVMAEVWRLDLPPLRKMVLLAIADHAHDDGTKAFPGVARIVYKTGISRRAVQQHLRVLEEAGLLVATAHGRGGRGMATEYRVDTGKGASLAPFGEWVKGADHDGKGASGVVKGAAGAPQPSVTIIQPSVRHLPASPPNRCSSSVPAGTCGVPEPCWLHDSEPFLASGRPGPRLETWQPTEGRQRDLLFEAFTVACGHPATEPEAGRYRKAAKDARASGMSPVNVLAISVEYRRRWPDIDMTPQAIVGNAGLLSRSRPGSVTAMMGRLRA